MNFRPEARFAYETSHFNDENQGGGEMLPKQPLAVFSAFHRWFTLTCAGIGGIGCCQSTQICCAYR